MPRKEKDVKPVGTFNAQVKVETCVVTFRDRRGNSIQFYPFDTPIINLSTETTSDSLFINSQSKFSDLWAVLFALFNKWNSSEETKNV